MLEKNVIIRKENNVTSYAKTRATDRVKISGAGAASCISRSLCAFKRLFMSVRPSDPSFSPTKVRIFSQTRAAGNRSYTKQVLR